MVLIIIEIDYDAEFYQEILKNPSTYGLTYESYKVLTFTA